MPFYATNPGAPGPKLMVGGQPMWLWGSYPDNVSATTFNVNSVALASNVATVVFTATGGNAPAVGSLITIRNTKTLSGLFNVTNVALTSVSTNLQTGVSTVTFALTGANTATTADSGFGQIPVPIAMENITGNAGSIAAASAENDPSTNDERSYFVQVLFGTLPTACTVSLQAALIDQDQAYRSVGTVATVAAGALTINNSSFPNLNARFVRIAVTGITGTVILAAAVMG